MLLYGILSNNLFKLHWCKITNRFEICLGLFVHEVMMARFHSYLARKEEIFKLYKSKVIENQPLLSRSNKKINPNICRLLKNFYIFNHQLSTIL